MRITDSQGILAKRFGPVTEQLQSREGYLPNGLEQWINTPALGEFLLSAKPSKAVPGKNSNKRVVKQKDGDLWLGLLSTSLSAWRLTNSLSKHPCQSRSLPNSLSMPPCQSSRLPNSLSKRDPLMVGVEFSLTSNVATTCRSISNYCITSHHTGFNNCLTWNF